jgi:hypothetical protein
MDALVNWKYFPKKSTYLDRTCYVPSLFWKNSSDINRENEFLKKFLFFIINSKSIINLKSIIDFIQFKKRRDEKKIRD